jgi:hypothetical protein
LLVIDDGANSQSQLCDIAFEANIAVSRLSFWEQITSLDSRPYCRGSLCVDGRNIGQEETIFLLARPKFLRPDRFSSNDIDHAWSEWNAALDAVLRTRELSVPNGRLLISSPDLATNQAFYRCRLASALDLPLLGAGTASSDRLWFLVSNCGVYISPHNRTADEWARAWHHRLRILMSTAQLDFLFLELCAQGSVPKLSRVHLMPPTAAPIDLVRVLLSTFRRQLS